MILTAPTYPGAVRQQCTASDRMVESMRREVPAVAPQARFRSLSLFAHTSFGQPLVEFSHVGNDLNHVFYNHLGKWKLRDGSSLSQARVLIHCLLLQTSNQSTLSTSPASSSSRSFTHLTSCCTCRPAHRLSADANLTSQC